MADIQIEVVIRLSEVDPTASLALRLGTVL